MLPRAVLLALATFSATLFGRLPVPGPSHLPLLQYTVDCRRLRCQGLDLDCRLRPLSRLPRVAPLAALLLA
eukprot:7349095-Lingulodinium_polyedra.AAC.1